MNRDGETLKERERESGREKGWREEESRDDVQDEEIEGEGTLTRRLKILFVEKVG